MITTQYLLLTFRESVQTPVFRR